MDAKRIPKTQGFMASVTGVITDKNGVVKNQYTNGDGYKTAAVLMEDGTWRTYGVHRLVALAHLKPPGNPKDLTVNHIDGYIENNVKDNLEWLSVKQNNSHAVLLRGSKHRPVIIGRSPDGKHQFIQNLAAAARIFECDEDLVWESIRDGRLLKGWLLLHHRSGEETPDELKKPQFMQNGRIGKIPRVEIAILDLHTKLVKKYESLTEAAKDHGVKASDIHQCISKGNSKRLFKRRYVIVVDGYDFPDISLDEYNDLLGPTGKSVLTYYFPLQKYIVYESASKFIKQYGLSKKAVSVDLKRGRIRRMGDWYYTYLSDQNAERLKDVVRLSGQ